MRRLLPAAAATTLVAVMAAVLPVTGAGADPGDPGEPVDTAPPTVTVTVPASDGDNGWYRTPPQVRLAARDLGSGIASGWVSMTGATTGSVEVVDDVAETTVTADGVTTITYEFTDNAGNARRGSVGVALDRAAPTASVVGGPASDIVRVGADVSVQAACGDPTSGVASCTLEGHLDPGTGRLHTGAAGDIAAIAVARDRAGHVTRSGRIFHVVEADARPSVHVTLPDPGPTGWYTSFPTLTASGTAGDPRLPVVGIQRTVAGVTTHSDGSSVRFGVAVDGRAVPVTVRAVDSEGGLSDPVTRTLGIDLDAPYGSIDGPDTYTVGEVAPVFAGCGDLVSGVARCEVTTGLDADGNIDTSVAGPLTLTLLIVDKAGHETRIQRVVTVQPEPGRPSTVALAVPATGSSRAPLPVTITLGGAGVDGGLVTLVDGGRTLGSYHLPAGTGTTTTLRVRLPRPTVGRHRIEARYAGGPGADPATALSSPVVVRSPALVTARYPLVRGRRLAAVTVRGLDAAATGRVVVLDGGRRVGYGTLRSGRALVRLTPLRRGVHRLRVAYLGSSRVLPASSRTAVVRA